MKGISMPKAYLVFTLPEEREEFDLARNAIDYSIVLSEYSNWLRAIYKHTDQENIKVEEAREKLFELCREYGVEL